MSYDVIIVLGSQPNPETWRFPQQIYDCLDKTIELFNQNKAPFIATSGKWGISLDNKGLCQPFRECDELADYLISKGIPTDKILREGDSKDTISNLYYLKNQLLIPRQMNNLLFVVAEWRIPRLEFLCERILGGDYSFSFEPIACIKPVTQNEDRIFKDQKEFLSPMEDGDESWLDDKFYGGSLYQKIDKIDKQQIK